jgi:histidinol-phosphate phosphatase family protein
MLQAVVIAGGEGQRIKSVLGNTPKILSPIGKNTLLDIYIKLFKKNNIQKIHFCLGIGGHEILQKLKNSYPDLNYTYEIEEKRLGTYGALINSYEYLEDSFFLILGDILTDININNFARKFSSKKSDLMLISRFTDHPKDSDIIISDEASKVTKISRHEDIHYPYSPVGNTGLFFINKNTLILDSEYAVSDFTKDFLRKNLNNLDITAEISIDFIRDIGTPERLKKGVAEYFNFIMNKNKFLFIDRDGTLISNLGDTCNWKKVEFIEGSINFLKTVQESGYRVVMFTNQPGVAKGFFKLTDLDNVHSEIQHKLIESGCKPLSFIKYCPHHPETGFIDEVKDLKVNCNCRKPKTGMYDEFLEQFNLKDLNTIMVGDTSIDLEFGKKIGAKTYILKNEHSEAIDSKFLVDSFKNIVNFTF